jgi:hypothetical protein
MGRSALQARSIANHGGLTPAAPVNVRLCIARVVIFSRPTPCNQERLA